MLCGATTDKRNLEGDARIGQGGCGLGSFVEHEEHSHIVLVSTHTQTFELERQSHA